MTYQLDNTALTTGELARRCGADTWQVHALIRRGLLPEPARIGHFRLWTAADVDRVLAALEKGGYLRGRQATAPCESGVEYS